MISLASETKVFLTCVRLIVQTLMFPTIFTRVRSRRQLIAAQSARADSFCSSRRSPLEGAPRVGYGGAVVAAGIIRHGTSSSMRLIGWPSAILARMSRR